MKVFTLLAVAATLASDAIAQPHHHSHNHVKRHAHGHDGSKVKRAPKTVTNWVAGPIETVYELEGVEIPEEDAKKGLAKGHYLVAGETEPELPEMPEEPEEEDHQGAQFYEQPETTEAAPTTTAEPEPTPTPAETTDASNGGNQNSGGNTEGQGLDSPFPSGEIDCSTFPESYGPVRIDYLGLNGWTGIQICPSFSPGSLISYVETAISGGGCSKKSFCSYACPVGYQKTQWPKEQGAKKESIGGLYCNENGKLELSRPEKQTLCEPGAGGVTIQNDLDVQVSTCRTDYPGTESMTIPTIAQGGQSGIPLTNPDAQDYYVWDGKQTSAQYYVNKKGRGAEQACLWDASNDHDGSGNWAPVNIGVGKAADGNTYLSIFPNKPTTNAQLDFNIEIIGDVNSECALVNGQYTGGGNGCTTAFAPGKSAIIRYY